MDIRNFRNIPYMEFPTGRKTRVMIGQNGAVKGELFCQGYVEIDPSGSIPEHDHETCESYTILSGNGELTVDGEVSAVGPGDYAFLHPWQKHSLVNTGQEPMTLMFVYAPQIVVDHWDKELKGTL